MSYNPVKNEDSLSEVFSLFNDYKLIEKKMLEKKNSFEGFIFWFNKAMNISPRNTMIFIKKYYKQFNEDIQSYIGYLTNVTKQEKEYYK